MSSNVKDTNLIDTEASDLLGDLLSGNMELLSEQDKFVLTENRKAIVQHINTIFSKEIPPLLEGKTCSDATALFWGLKLARLLEASETFQWIEKLCHISIKDLEYSLGDYFITEELSYLLADTMIEWSVLKDVIENQAFDEFIRSACIDALIFSVVKKGLDRLEITDYFKSLFHRILSGELDDEMLCTLLVCSCSDLWPGECLEEIRESFGLTLVDEFHIDIDCVLEKFSSGKDYCIENLQKQIKRHSSWEFRPGFTDLSDEEQSQKFDRLIQLSDQAQANADRTLKQVNKGSQRNEICGCRSGRKYKKCCMNKPSQEIPSNIIFEESVISYSPLEESEEMKALPEEVKESMLALYHLLEEKPEEVIKKTPEYISKHPNIPTLYNFLYGAYGKSGHPREATKIMKETVQLFPNYLFARVEYARYMLRRGEPDKAHAALENARTLSQLYPERKIFHASEWNVFAYAMSLYWIQKGDINQAKIYLGIIQKITPNSYQVTDLQKKMKRNLYLQSMEKMQKDVEP
ncbi:MAG: DUF1186 domain-containing protein [Chlamydiae bacterium]|nr:DUF1186 domain-containing protein [Chlamydiota bacterium]